MDLAIYELFSFSTMLLNTFAMLNVVLIVEVPFGARLATNTKKLTIASILFVFMELFIKSNFSHNHELIIVAIEYAFMVAAVFLFSTEKRFRNILLTIPAVFVYVQWGSIGDLIERLLGLDKYSIQVDHTILSPMLYIIDITLFLILLLLKKYAQNKSMNVSLTLGEAIFLTIFCFFGPTLMDILANLEVTFQNPIYNLAWVIFILALNIAVIYGIAYRKRAKYYKQLSQTYRQHFDEEHNHFKEYKSNNRETAKFRHDWNNHILVLQGLLQDGKYEEAQKYFSSFPLANSSKYKKILTGNDTVDTIFAGKMNLFEENDIELIFEGNLCVLNNIEPLDLCILFANLIDNAIEACLKCAENRYLHIRVKESPNMLMIIFTNSMEGTLDKNDNSIRTSKADKNLHGIGLENVKEIITKYKGEYYIQSKKGLFEIKIILSVN